MNNTFRFLSVGFATLLSTLVGCAAPPGDSDDAAGAGAAATVGAKPRVELVDVDVTKPATDTSFESMKECSIRGTYAKVSGMSDPAAQTKLNAALQPEEIRSLETEGCDLPFSMDFTTKLLFESAEVLSVERSGSDYWAGAAHPNNSLHAQSYDVKTGEPLGVAQVFSDASGKQLAQKVLAKLQAGNAEEKEMAELFGDQLLEGPEYVSFALTGDAVIVYLTPYAGHATFASALEPVTLRYAELGDALSATSPAARLWAKRAN